MHISARTRLVAGIQSAVFVLLLAAVVGMLAWISEHYKVQWDWTAAGRNTLSEPSQLLLARLTEPVEITAYVREEPLIRQSILQLLERYKRHKPDISVRFVNPDLVPDEVRKRNISTEGEMVLSYRNREERARQVTEEALTSALERLARADTRWVTYTRGHGERDLLGTASYDLGRLGTELQRQGFRLHELALAEIDVIPDDVAVLVVSSGRRGYSSAEIGTVVRYLENGGNLLWLADPGASADMEPVARALGVVFEPGIVVDPTTRVLGIDHPAFVPVSAYPAHPITESLDRVTVYPHAAGIAWSQPPGWQTRGILSTGLRAWSETGVLEGELAFDDGADVSGPLDIGIALERTLGSAEDGNQRRQRAVVIGDGDFLSNAYIGTGANLRLALNVFNWLADDETLIDISPRAAPDIVFDVSPATAGLIRFSLAFGLPALLLGAGFFIWHRRRRL